MKVVALASGSRAPMLATLVTRISATHLRADSVPGILPGHDEE
jgi:hypothetical protein